MGLMQKFLGHKLKIINGHIIVHTGSNPGRKEKGDIVELERGVIQVGRGDENNFEINVPSVSRRHCQLIGRGIPIRWSIKRYKDAEELCVKKKGDEVPVNLQPGKEQDLNKGDRIVLAIGRKGKYVIEFEYI